LEGGSFHGASEALGPRDKHGDDLLFRSRVGGALVAAALEPLLAVADRDEQSARRRGQADRPNLVLEAVARVGVAEEEHRLRVDLVGEQRLVEQVPVAGVDRVDVRRQVAAEASVLAARPVLRVRRGARAQ
jgi:hypothetical protein